MNVNFKGKPYTVSRLASGYQWRLTAVCSKRDTVTLSYEQMVAAGLVNATGKNK